ncbi:MAG: L,D-transpeptidase, partial [Pseudobdellovibrionaceae bacterium]
FSCQCSYEDLHLVFADCYNRNEKYGNGSICNGTEVYLTDENGTPQSGQVLSFKGTIAKVQIGENSSRLIEKDVSTLSRQQFCLESLCQNNSVFAKDGQGNIFDAVVKLAFANGKLLLIDRRSGVERRSYSDINKVSRTVSYQNGFNIGQKVFFRSSSGQPGVGQVLALTETKAKIKFQSKNTSFIVYPDLSSLSPEVNCIRWLCQNNFVQFKDSFLKDQTGQIKSLFANNQVLIAYKDLGGESLVWRSMDQVVSSNGFRPPITGDTLLNQRKELARQFPLVVYINKSDKGSYAQTIYVFEARRLLWSGKVSTGRERQETPTGIDFDGKPFAPYFSSTPVGFFTPTWLDKEHKSKLWDADMPFSIFFKDGVAMHQAAPAYEDRLGTRASGGCVRLSAEMAAQLFDLVQRYGQKTIPSFTEDGVIRKNSWGGTLMQSKGYQTLIIVDDSPSDSPDLLRVLQSL